MSKLYTQYENKLEEIAKQDLIISNPNSTPEELARALSKKTKLSKEVSKILAEIGSILK